MEQNIADCGQRSYHSAVSQFTIEKLALIFAFIVAGTAVLHYTSQSHWQKLVSAEGAFNVLMPGKPKQEALSFQVREVRVEGQSFSALSQRNAQFSVVYAQASVLPTAPQQELIFDAQRKVLTHGDETRLISAEKMVVNGYPVRQYKAVTEDGSQADERLYIVERRLYMLLVLHDRRQDEPDVKTFFDSFVFKQK